MVTDKKEWVAEIVKGAGNLDARLLWAAQVGRYRVAHGEKKAVTVRQASPLLISDNRVQYGVCQFVGISLPAGAAVDPATVLFSKESQLGNNTSIPARLTTTMGSPDVGAPGVGAGAFFCILLPEEQLFAQLPPGALTDLQIVVSRVPF